MKKIRYTELQTKAGKWEKMMHKSPDGFRPCPICGRKLTMNDIQFYDCDGERIGDLETMHDFEHASRELRFRLRAAAVGLLDGLNWHLDWEDDGKDLARKCEDLALMLKRYDYEMMKRR